MDWLGCQSLLLFSVNEKRVPGELVSLSKGNMEIFQGPQEAQGELQIYTMIPPTIQPWNNQIKTDKETDINFQNSLDEERKKLK